MDSRCVVGRREGGRKEREEGGRRGRRSRHLGGSLTEGREMEGEGG
jgi:hypothetical protein